MSASKRDRASMCERTIGFLLRFTENGNSPKKSGTSRAVKWSAFLASLMSLAFIIASCNMNPVQEGEKAAMPDGASMPAKASEDNRVIPASSIYYFSPAGNAGVVSVKHPSYKNAIFLTDAGAFDFTKANVENSIGVDFEGNIVGIDSLVRYPDVCLPAPTIRNYTLSMVDDESFDTYINMMLDDCVGEAEKFEKIYVAIMSATAEEGDVTPHTMRVLVDVDPSDIEVGNATGFYYGLEHDYDSYVSYPRLTNVSDLDWASVYNIKNKTIVIACTDPNRETEADGSCAASCKEGYDDVDGVCQATTSILERPRVIPGQNGWERQ